jgi:hypothetical protein
LHGVGGKTGDSGGVTSTGRSPLTGSHS